MGGGYYDREYEAVDYSVVNSASTIGAVVFTPSAPPAAAFSHKADELFHTNVALHPSMGK